MQKYNVKIKLVTPYLQARFSDEAKKSLKVKAGNKAKIQDDDSWKSLLYKDKKEGIYIPSAHFRECLVNGGKSVKKKPVGSFKEIVQSYFFIEPAKIYIGKLEPDEINESYPSRKEGTRVKLLHPKFHAGLEIDFIIGILHEEVIDAATIQLILQTAGREKGIGAWRAGGHGRFETIKFEVIN